MKREIKFRAWYKNKMYINVQDIYDSGNLNGDCFGHLLDDDDTIIEQFTGLKDKNGVDIYEGDIVRWDDDSDGKYWRICEIMWKKSHFELVGFTYDTDNPKARRYVNFKFGAFIYEYDGGLEVIGNIHESQELIK